MTRTLTVISPDNGTDAFSRVVDALNAQFEDRNLIGNLDGMDASFEVCLSDAVSSFEHGTWDAIGVNYYVAIEGAPLAQILGK
jgi:hypothetical protein